MMTTTITEVRDYLGGEKFPRCESPSLRLEKFLRIGEDTKADEVKQVVDCHNRNCKIVNEYALLTPSGVQSFTAILESRMMVNQAGGMLENAGLCLHRHFGYPFIPGSAVKGIARHAAWSEWNAAQDEEARMSRAKRVADVFGFPTGDSSLDHYLASIHYDVRKQGSIAFLSAVPVKRASLVSEILTPHGGNDWTDPVPSAFPAVEKGTEFRFSIVPLRNGGRQLAEDALRFLKTGLVKNGAGAKTNAGYGWFSIEGFQLENEDTCYELKLDSPAFLRGSESDPTCDLRVATLRGQLRWWWRVLYRSLLSEADLNNLEKRIWGGAGTPPSASMIGVRISRLNPPLFSSLYDREVRGITMPANFIQNRTKGIAYATYGMDENRQGVRARRMVLEATPQSAWRVSFFIRNEGGLDRARIIEHARLALLALCNYGGVGAKSRKGFGSLSCGEAFPDDASLFGRILASLDGLGVTPNVNEQNMPPYSMLSAVRESVSVRASDPWHVLDRVGHAIQNVASDYKHNRAKAVLGLPRKIHGPRWEPLRDQHDHTQPEELVADHLPVRKRFAAPYCIHLSPIQDRYDVNITAFPSPYVRNDLAISEKIIDELLQEIRQVLTTSFP